MIWAVLLLLGVVAAVHWFDYQRSVQEYTIAQPATLEDVRGIIGDKTPVVVEIGALPWRPEVAGIAAWNVTVAAGGNEDGGVLDMPVSAWVKEPATTRPAIVNGGALAEEMGLTTGLAELDESRAFWWMPGLMDPEVGILEPGHVAGLKWIGAERRWFGCSGGAPVILWIVHSRYRRYLPEADGGVGVDPWALTVAEAPWIGRVQFIEVRVRPGWCLGLPAHWGYAVRAEGDTGSWWWTADQHSPLSRLVGSV